MASGGDGSAQVTRESERRSRLAVPAFAGGVLYLLSAIIIQATGDGSPDITPAEVVRFKSPRDDPTTPHLAPAPLQILAPLAGLNAVRGGHSNVLLRQARQQYGERFFHFFLPGDGGKEVPLNWVLSDATTAFIRRAINEDKQSGNARELQRLHEFK